MQDAELEGVVTEFFLSRRGQERDAETEKRVLCQLECLPRQVRSFSTFDNVLFDWKLTLSWTRVALLLGCALLGLLVGVEAFGTCDGRGGTFA